MSITRHDVLQVAKLARLGLEEHEVERMMHDLTQILAYMEQLDELDTTSIPPTAHVAVEQAPLRPDQVLGSLSTKAALSEAPRRCENNFAVPAFVEGG